MEARSATDIFAEKLNSIFVNVEEIVTIVPWSTVQRF